VTTVYAMSSAHGKRTDLADNAVKMSLTVVKHVDKHETTDKEQDR